MLIFMAASSGRKKAGINRWLLCALIHLSRKEGEDPQHIFFSILQQSDLLLVRASQTPCVQIYEGFISFTCARVTHLVSSEIVQAVPN